MDEFRECPACGYKLGFHVSFKKEEAGYIIIFICPSCGASFDLNLFEDRLSELKVKPGKKY